MHHIFVVVVQAHLFQFLVLLVVVRLGVELYLAVIIGAFRDNQFAAFFIVVVVKAFAVVVAAYFIVFGVGVFLVLIIVLPFLY